MNEGFNVLPSGYVRFTPPVEFDLAAAQEVVAELDYLIELHPRIAVDLTAVTFIDSSGLSTLVWIHKQSQRLGGDVVLFGAGPRIRRMLELTQLDHVFPVYAEADEIPPWTPEAAPPPA